MNINNNTNNIGNNLNINNNYNKDQKSIANEFLTKTEQKNSDIISSLIESRKENSEIFKANLGNRNIQNIITSLQTSSNSLEEASTILKNLKALYLNLSSSNFSFEKVKNITEKTSIVIKQLKYIAKNTSHEDTPLLSGRKIEYNIYIKNRPQTLKLNFVSLLKIASSLEDIKIKNADSIKEAIDIINKGLFDIDRSNKKISRMNKNLQSVVDYYNKNNSEIKNTKQALKIIQNCKNILLGENEKDNSLIGLFKNLNIVGKKSEDNYIDESTILNDELDSSIEDTNKDISNENLNDDILANKEDIEKASRALKNLVVYDDTEYEFEDNFNLFKESIEKNQKEIKKENIFASFDEEYINNENDKIGVDDILKKISEKENKSKEKIDETVDENFVALLTGKNPNKNKSKYIWTAFYFSLGATVLVLALSFINR